jgi:hypothetical protein
LEETTAAKLPASQVAAKTSSLPPLFLIESLISEC